MNKKKPTNYALHRASVPYQTWIVWLELRKYVANYKAINDIMSAEEKKSLPTILRQYCKGRNERLKKERYNLKSINFNLIAKHWDNPDKYPQPKERH